MPRDQDEEGEEELKDGAVGEKRKAKEELVDTRKLKRQCRMKFQNYYRGYFYGSSTSSVLYELAKQMNRENKDALWCWIIGLSDLIVHSKAGELEYNDEIQRCNEEVFRLHPFKQNEEFVMHDSEL